MFAYRMYLIISFLLLNTTISFAQIDSLWSVTWGGEGQCYCHDMTETSDGCYVMGGYLIRDDEGYYSGDLVKVNDNGEIVWTSILTQEIPYVITKVIETDDGGFLTLGSEYSGAEWIFKTNSEGETIWSLELEYDDRVRDIIQTSDGGYLMVGPAWNIITKTDHELETEWTQEFDVQRLKTVVQNDQDGFTLLYSWGTGLDPSNSMLVFTDVNGDSLGSRLIEWESDHRFSSITFEPEVGYFVTGGNYWRENGTTSLAMLIDIEGETISSVTVRSQAYIRNVIHTIDGGYALGGSINRDFYLLKTDENGDSLWSRSFGGDHSEDFRSLIQNGSGEYLMAGTTFSFGEGNGEFWLVKAGIDTTNGIVDDQEFFTSNNFILNPAYPKPFNGTVTIPYQMPISGNVNVTVYDSFGREVALLQSEFKVSGSHQITWMPESMPSGTYMVKVGLANSASVVPVTLVK